MIKQLLICSCVLHFFSAAPLSIASEAGNPMPNCQLVAVNQDKTINLQQYQGKVVYLDFWASWCPSCVKSFPFLHGLQTDLKAQGLEVVAVNLDEQLADAKAFLAKHSGDFTAAIDSTKQCAKDFAVEGMPATYIIDRKGIIRHIHLGFRAEDAAQLRQQVELLLAEK